MARFRFLDRPALLPDDRGAIVSLLSIRDLKGGGDGPSGPRAALATHLKAAVRAEARRFNFRSLVRGLLFLVIWVTVLILINRTALRQTPFVRDIAFWGGLVAVVVISRSDARRQFSRQLSATAVAEGICGSCAYSLQSLAPEADGCVVCPECGAAWRRERITRPHWESGRPRAAPQPAWWWRFITATPPESQRLAPDDRGRFVAILDSRLLALPSARRRDMGPELVRSIRRRVREIGLAARTLVAIPLFLLAALCLWGLITAVQEAKEPLWIALTAGLAGLFSLAGAGVLVGHRFIHPRAAAGAIWEFRFCAACAQPLAGLMPEADGCVTCPGCGAGWRAAPPTVAPLDAAPSSR